MITCSKTPLLNFVALMCLMMSLPLQGKHHGEKEFNLAGIFGDNMVLQQDTEVAIWGTAQAKDQITIKTSWGGKAIKTVADEDGRWMDKIKTPKASNKSLKITVKCGSESRELKNILAGEVWICSGQSNMQWKLRGFGVAEFKEDVDKANFPQIRFCTIPHVLALELQDDVKTQWMVCNPRSIMQFSAVGYFFGSRLHQELDVPIGLVSTNWGGSAIEGWINPEILEQELEGYKNLTKHYEKWKKESGVIYDRTTKKPKGLNQSSPGVLYNSMLKPLVPFGFRGVIWYQGESNVKNPEEYKKLFSAMIKDWRKQWGIGDFPFYYVQIAPWAYKNVPISAAFLREAQLEVLSEPNTGMVVTMDVGDIGNIHPKRKKPVGERLALLALARDYGKKGIVDSGPLYKGFKVEGGKIRLEFDYIGGGLVAKGGGELTHFTIAGRNKKFVPAKAVVDGDTIIVSSDGVNRPVAVRFAWGSGDEPNLSNKEGLPASSFRTDDWPPKK